MFDSVDQSNNLNEAKRLNDSNGLNAKLNEVLGNERESMRNGSYRKGQRILCLVEISSQHADSRPIVAAQRLTECEIHG